MIRRRIPVLKDSKFLIYVGAPLTCAAVAIPTLPSDAVFCVDNRAMCAPLAQPADDEPSGNEPQPLLGKRSPLIAVTSATGTLNVPRYANLVVRIGGPAR
jgi:hypothetical protein